MPTVPRYTSPQVETQVVQEARAQSLPAAAFRDPGADRVQAIGQGVAGVAQGLAQMQQRVSIAAAEEASLAFEKEKNRIFYDPDQGYLNLQGRDAYDRAGDTLKALEKAERQYAEGLPTEAAKKAYTEVVARQRLRAEQDIQRHAAQGIRAWEVATTNARVENSIEEAALYWNDPENLELQRAIGRQAVIDAADLEGLTGEPLKERLQNFESAFAAQAIEAAATVSSADAESLMEKMGDRLEGPQQAKMRGAIAKMKVAEKDRQDSQLAVLRGTNLVDQFGEEPNARTLIMEEVNAIEDPELRKKVRTEALHQLDVKQTADSEARAAVFEEAETQLLNGLSIESFIAENPRGWQALTAKQKRTLMAGPVVQTDHALLSDLLLLPKDQLAKIKPSEYFDSLSKSDRNRLTSAVNSARQGNTEAQVGRSIISQTNTTMEQIIGKSKSDWSNKQRQQANALYDLINDEVKFREERKGGPLTSQEYTSLLNDMTRTVVQGRSLFGVDRLFPDREIDITEIPAEDIPVISQHLHDNGIPATAENIIKAYQQAIQ